MVECPRDGSRLLLSVVKGACFLHQVRSSVLLLSCVELPLQLLEIDLQGCADLAQPVTLLGTNLRLHAVFFGSELHVELCLALSEEKLLLGECYRQSLLLDKQ